MNRTFGADIGYPTGLPAQQAQTPQAPAAAPASSLDQSFQSQITK